MTGRRIALLVAGCTGCLIADAPDGDWRALTNDCVPLGEEPTAVLRNEPFLHAFVLAGDTIIFNDADGLTQLALRDRERSLIARTNSDDAASEFQTMENDLVYYARGEFGGRDLIVDRGVAETPRWITIASFIDEDFTRVHANHAGVYWRSDLDAKWRRWNRSTNAIVDSGLPDDAIVTTDGEQLFYSTTHDFVRHGLYTLPVDGGTPTMIADADQATIPVGIGDSRYFVWHQDLPNYFDEVTPGGLFNNVTMLVELGVPGRRTFGGGYFYWVPIVDGPDTILRVPLDGGSQERVATVPTVEGAFGTIQADACNVYWQVVREGSVDLYAQRH